MRIKNQVQGVFVFCLLSITITFGSKNVQAQCIADFTSGTTHAFIPTQFTDLSTTANGVINSWEWDFGDGETSNVQNPTHVYTAGGTYTVCIIIETTLGCSDTTCHSVIVGPQHPQASFSASSVCDGDSMCFSDQSNAYGGEIVSWLWYFGDGQSSTDQNPCHIYTTFGIYNVMLIVTNDFGCQDGTTIQVEVYPNPVANFSYSNYCDFEVNFTDLSIAHATSLVAWGWSFGDGGTSTFQNPTYTYSGLGTYTVFLYVVNSNGCIDSITLPVVVTEMPIADFTADTACEGKPTQFTDLSIPGHSPLISWAWDFGDGSTSTLQNPTHIYTSTGIYLATLIIASECGGMDSIAKEVLVEDDAKVSMNNSINPRFNIYPNPFKEGISITFNLSYPTRVNIEVINTSGKIKASIINEQYPAGEHQLRWNSKGQTAGVYILKMTVGENVYTSKIVKSP